MHSQNWLAEQFEEQRDHLQAVAYRMLGSLSDANDAVQTSWVKLSKSDTRGVENLGGWMTTIVARVCLDMLRTRKAHGEAPSVISDEIQSDDAAIDPEKEVQLAESVGLAMLVVLDALSPDERLAFVLHDVFAMPFDDIAPIVGQSVTAARQLASRARRRMRGTAAVPADELDRQREVVSAFLAAARTGEFDALLALLDPDVILRIGSTVTAAGEAVEVKGARRVAKMYGRPGGAQGLRAALVNGSAGFIVAPLGRLLMIITLKFNGDKIAVIDAAGGPERLKEAEIALLMDGQGDDSSSTHG